MSSRHRARRRARRHGFLLRELRDARGRRGIGRSSVTRISHQPGTVPTTVRSGTRQSSDERFSRPEFWRIQLRVVRKASWNGLRRDAWGHRRTYVLRSPELISDCDAGFRCQLAGQGAAVEVGRQIGGACREIDGHSDRGRAECASGKTRSIARNRCAAGRHQPHVGSGS